MAYGLSALVQTKLEQSPFSGHVFVFRGRRGDLIKILWWDEDGLCLFAKRLERGRFVWPQATEGSVGLTRAQLSMLLEGIDWRRPVRTAERSWRSEFPLHHLHRFPALWSMHDSVAMAYCAARGCLACTAPQPGSAGCRRIEGSDPVAI